MALSYKYCIIYMVTDLKCKAEGLKADVTMQLHKAGAVRVHG